MKRKSYDRWGIEITSFNRNIAFHVECDCGELAKRVLLQSLKKVISFSR
ncbi:hypothetical protein [Enterococcus dispar]|nr:hypothetical protein [Enterococcus dispar]MDT2706940.1 hypothetical protein [Enterococcus dispar]